MLEEFTKSLKVPYHLTDEGLFVLGNNKDILALWPKKSIQMIYTDPPYGTGNVQKMTRLKSDPKGDQTRSGYLDKGYKQKTVSSLSYADPKGNWWQKYGDVIEAGWSLLKDSGSLYLHLDQRAVHRVKVTMDDLWGEDHFLNELIWAYDYGGKPKNKWPQKHDTVLLYIKDPDKYYFNNERVEREPYMAPGLVSEEKRKKGKMPTDVIWHTIVPTQGKERTGYPTQKPLGLVKRFVAASCPEGGIVLDPYGGSGTTAEAAKELGCKFILIDQNPEAAKVWIKRFGLPHDAFDL